MSITRYNASYTISIFSIILYSTVTILNYLVYLSILTINTETVMGCLLLFIVSYGLIQYFLVLRDPEVK